MDWLPWSLLVAASLHICEEFLFPGGFSAWYRRYRSNASWITRRFLVLINAGLLVMCGEVVLVWHTPLGVPAWLGVSALLCSNGCWHAWTTYKLRAYSPGVITGVAIYAPLAVYGYIRLLSSGAASVLTALIACAIGGSYQLWSAAFHSRA